MKNFTPAAVSVLLVAALLAASASLAGQSATDSVERELEIEYRGPAIASRSGVSVSLTDLDGRLASIPEDRIGDVLADPQRIAGLINDVLLTQYLADAALERGALQDPAVQAEIYFNAIQVLAKNQRDHHVRENMLDDYTPLAREIYLTDKDSFRTPETVTFTHLLLRTGQNDVADVEQRARELLERARSGDSLADLAVEFSEDPSVQDNRGRFSEISPSRLDRQFQESIAGIGEGEIGLARSQHGFHVVEVEERSQPTQQGFDEIADRLRERARNEHRQELFEDYAAKFYDQPLELTDGAVERIIEHSTGNGGD